MDFLSKTDDTINKQLANIQRNIDAKTAELESVNKELAEFASFSGNSDVATMIASLNSKKTTIEQSIQAANVNKERMRKFLSSERAPSKNAFIADLVSNNLVCETGKNRLVYCEDIPPEFIAKINGIRNDPSLTDDIKKKLIMENCKTLMMNGEQRPGGFAGKK